MIKSLKITAMFLIIIFASLGASYSTTYYPCPMANTITCKIENINNIPHTFCDANVQNSKGETVNWAGALGKKMNLPLALTLKGPHHETTLNANTCTYNYNFAGETEIMEFATPSIQSNPNCYVSSKPQYNMGWTCPDQESPF